MDRLADRITARRLAATTAILAGLAVFLIAHEVFPYHSSNHDEAVYLQQASMLLEGQLALDPPVVEPFRPWFFVVDGGQLYPKYTPVTAATFAAGKLLGGFRIALGLVAAAAVWLTYATVAEAFDRQHGFLAGLLLVCSPIFLVEASVFLPYVPAMVWTLLFAWAYFRGDRTGDPRFGALAGLAIGIGFWARPYTAVLFALPFVVHALWTLRTVERPRLYRHGLTVALGCCGVAVALAYNAAVTGSATTFPYQAFAPRDGLGFGYHEITGYGRVYDVPLALEATARNLAQYVTRWSVAPPVGVLVAAGGLWATLTDLRERVRATGGRAVGRRLVLAGLAVSIPLGQSYFWGSLNVLGDLSDPTDGLVSFLGPYYHLGLVVPTVAFGAHGLLVGGRRARQFLRGRNSARVRAAGLAILAVAGLVTGGLATAAVAGPLGDNADVTRQYERAYEPIESAEFENALVFVPTPYGDWLNHPFQYLRTDPGYDGEVVYALQERQFAVRDAFPDRSLYRYVYRGEWAPFLNRSVEGRLQEIRVATGEEVSLSIEAEVPESVQSLSVRASTTGNGYALAESPGERITFTVRFLDGQAVIESPEFESPVVLPVAGRERLEVRLFADSGGAGSFSYDLTIPVEYDGTYRVLTPRIEVCRNPRLCDGEAAYIPGQHREGVAIEAGFLR